MTEGAAGQPVPSVATGLPADAVPRSRRVRVVLSDRRPGHTPVRRADEVEEQTPIGRELVRGLMRAQLAAALRVAVVGVLLFAPLPAVFALVPAVRDAMVAGVPLVWWMLGLIAYPVLYVLGRIYRTRADRIEREFADLLEHT